MDELQISCSFTLYTMIRMILNYHNNVQIVIKFKFVHVTDFNK